MKKSAALMAMAMLGGLVVCQIGLGGETPLDPVRTISVAAIGKPLVAKLDSKGTIHLLCDSTNGPVYARSTNGGSSFGEAIPVIGGPVRQTGLESQAWDMAIGTSGRVHVALGTNAWKLKLPQEQWGYFYTTLEPGAETFSSVRNLNKRPSEGFSLAADGKGNVTACWLADKLYANVSHDDGATFGPSFELDSRFNPCNCCTTSAVYGRDGRLAILYREETNNERDMYVVSWDQASGETARERVGQTPWKINACPMTYFTIAADSDGFVATWPTSGSISFARLGPGARPLRPLEVQTPGRSGMRTGMIGLAGSGGKTLVAWKQNNRIGWQLYDAANRPEGSPGSAESLGNGVAGVVLGDRFLLLR